MKKPAPTKLYNSITLGRGLPASMTVTHRYHDFISLTSTIGSVAYYSFRANGMFDPNFTGVGHQPLYFDQISPLYNHYVIAGSKITFRISNRSATNPVMCAGSFLNDDFTNTPTFDALAEQAKSNSITIPFGSNNLYTLKNYFSSRKFFHIKDFDGDQYNGTASNDPAEQAAFTLWTYSPLAGTGTIDIEVFIEYIAVWKELKDIASS